MAIEKSKDEELKKEGSQTSKAENQEENKESNDQMVPLSQVKALIAEETKRIAEANNNANLATEIAKALSEANHQNQRQEKFDELQYLSHREIEKDQILDQPVTFWAIGVLFVIGDDKRNGRAVKAPYGTIVFKPMGEKRQQSGKETRIQIISTYDCWYKSELEWLESHTLFRSRFYKKSSALKSLDIRKAQKVASYVSGMMNIHASQVIKMAKDAGIDFTDDIDSMRIAVAQKKADEDISKWEESEKVTLRENAKADLMVKGG